MTSPVEQLVVQGSVLAVDVGKTTCRAVVWSGDQVVGSGQAAGAPGLAQPGGPEAAVRAVLAAAGPPLRRAGIGRLDAVGVGCAGALAAVDAAQELAVTLMAALAVAAVAVTSDAITSHAGALGGGPGVVLAIGTGAVAVVAKPGGECLVVDGYGPWLGDEGGGGQIGLEGLRAALRATDGRGPATGLEAVARSRFGELSQLPRVLAADPNPVRVAASFAPEVARLAAAGDQVAGEVLREAAAALAATTLAAARGLGVSRGPVPVAIVGGLLHVGRPLLDPLHDALGASAVPLWIRPPAGTAIEGARLLAVREDTLLESRVVRVNEEYQP